MAISVDDIVTPAISVGAAASPSSPLFGRVTDDGGGAGPFEVLWEDGTIAKVATASALDEIDDAAPPVQLLLGTVVEFTQLDPGLRLRGPVVRTFKHVGTGTDYVVVQTKVGYVAGEANQARPLPAL